MHKKNPERPYNKSNTSNRIHPNRTERRTEITHNPPSLNNQSNNIDDQSINVIESSMVDTKNLDVSPMEVNQSSTRNIETNAFITTYDCLYLNQKKEVFE